MTRSLSTRSPRRPGGNPTADELVRHVVDHPAALLTAAIVGPGGTGKTVTMDAVARAYEQAGVPVLRNEGHQLSIDRLHGERAVLVDDAHRLDPRDLDALRGLPENAGCRLVLATARGPGRARCSRCWRTPRPNASSSC